MTDREKWGVRRHAGLWACAALGLLLLAGCGGAARTSGALPGQGAAPLELGARVRAPGAGAPSVLSVLDEVRVRQGIENYRINKKRTPGPMQIAGADLNEDGVPEALVLFGGKDWCAPTGCSLAVFKADSRGYKAISRTVRVKAPVVIAPGQTNGWRDLFVSTGGAGGAPLRRVRLRFTGNGYARNAMLEEEIPPDVPQFGEVAVQAPAPARTVHTNGNNR